MKVVWHNEKYLINQTAEADGVFTPDGLYQIYERVDDTDNWERLPKGGSKNGIVWYKSKTAAIKEAKKLTERNK